MSRELESTATEKLQKVLARAGVASRRASEALILEGRVKINGRVAVVGDRAGASDRVMFDGKPIFVVSTQPVRILLYHKPEGEVCTQSDPDHRPTVFDHLPKLTQGRWIAVGRLDINTTGLLLFTNNGELANQLMHPSANAEREYQVRVLGDITPAIITRLEKGVMLEDGLAAFKSVTMMRGNGANKWCRVILMEGRNREVKRLFESQGLKVNKLKRVRFGDQRLPKTLLPGAWLEGSW